MFRLRVLVCPLDLLRQLELAALPDFVRLWHRVLDRPINGTPLLLRLLHHSLSLPVISMLSGWHEVLPIFKIYCRYSRNSIGISNCNHVMCTVGISMFRLYAWLPWLQSKQTSSQSSKSIATTRATPLLSVIVIILRPRSISLCRIPYSVSICCNTFSNF